ncbi:MAG: hypothetical protein M3Q03_12025, partial [Chloroflexota bacterium]|nr:hypothetical protein [Chloroflexota bacterium]
MDARETRQGLSRRTVLRLGAGIGAGLALGASMPRSSVLAQSTPSAATPVPGENVVVMVGDVVDFTLEPEGRWPAPVGSVTLTMHPGFFDGQDAWFIATDASD